MKSSHKRRQRLVTGHQNQLGRQEDLLQGWDQVVKSLRCQCLTSKSILVNRYSFVFHPTTILFKTLKDFIFVLIFAPYLGMTDDRRADLSFLFFATFDLS